MLRFSVWWRSWGFRNVRSYGLGPRIQGPEAGGLGFRAYGVGARVLRLGSRAYGLEVGVQCLCFWVWGLEARV
eukprot:539736-Rhodomonas_salina.6